jgi:hypothetical protein
MIVTYRDELGVISVSGVVDVQIGLENVYFTDGNGTDYKKSFYELISIEKENEAE